MEDPDKSPEWVKLERTVLLSKAEDLTSGKKIQTNSLPFYIIQDLYEYIGKVHGRACNKK